MTDDTFEGAIAACVVMTVPVGYVGLATEDTALLTAATVPLMLCAAILVAQTAQVLRG